MMRRAMTALAALTILALGACGDDATSTPCQDDTACATGQVCGNGSCQTIPCAGAGDCLSVGQICIEHEGSKVCSARQCNGPGDCATGEVCNLGQCVSDEVTTDCTTDGCPEGQTCNAETGACEAPATDCTTDGCPEGETCNAETGACETPTTDCTTDGCPEGETCNAETGACEEQTVGDGTPCAACANAEECPTGWSCKPLASGKACLPPCGTNEECDTGWTCQGDPAVCTPSGFRCDGCISEGCADGQVCNTNTGECATPRALCEPCTYGWECGADAACIKTGPGARACMPRCGDGKACPTNSVCETDADAGMKVCKSEGESCCYSEDPTECIPQGECNPPCEEPTPFCLGDARTGGACVQCLNDTHCDGALECEALSGSCVDPNNPTECTADQFIWEGECVDCLNNTHCAEGTYCNSTSHVCTEQGSVCDTCGGDYPACVDVNGDFYCVPCDSDDDCGDGGDGCSCNLQTYSCDGECTSSTIDKCETDADCDPGITGFTLKCDTASGLCYDTKGQCDGVTAFCKGGGNCLSFMEAFLGEGAGGGFEIPGLPGGGGQQTLPGMCECDILAELAGAGVCGEAFCLPMESIFELLAGGGSTGGGPGIGGNFCFSMQ